MNRQARIVHETESHNNKAIVAVAGGGAKLESSILWQMLFNRAAQDGHDCYIVESRYADDQGENHIINPSKQQEMIENQIASLPESQEKIVIGQCLGSIAVSRMLENNTDNNVQAVMISPPLPSPLKVIEHPQSISKRGGEMWGLQSSVYDFHTLGNFVFTPSERSKQFFTLTPQYYEEIKDSSRNFIPQTIQQIARQALTLYSTGLDWNSDSPSIARSFKKNIHLSDRIILAPQMGHSLEFGSVDKNDTGEGLRQYLSIYETNVGVFYRNIINP